MNAEINERIKFKLFEMPCCGHQLCWVNPRLPSYCPECGKPVYTQLRTGLQTLLQDDEAWIKYHKEVK